MSKQQAGFLTLRGKYFYFVIMIFMWSYVFDAPAKVIGKPTTPFPAKYVRIFDVAVEDVITYSGEAVSIKASEPLPGLNGYILQKERSTFWVTISKFIDGSGSVFRKMPKNSHVSSWSVPIIFDTKLWPPVVTRLNSSEAIYINGDICSQFRLGRIFSVNNESVGSSPQLSRIDHQSTSEYHEKKSYESEQKSSSANNCSLVMVKGVGDLNADEGERFFMGAFFIFCVLIFFANIAAFYLWPEIYYGTGYEEKAKDKNGGDDAAHD